MNGAGNFERASHIEKRIGTLLDTVDAKLDVIMKRLCADTDMESMPYTQEEYDLMNNYATCEYPLDDELTSVKMILEYIIEEFILVSPQDDFEEFEEELRERVKSVGVVSQKLAKNKGFNAAGSGGIEKDLNPVLQQDLIQHLRRVCNNWDFAQNEGLRLELDDLLSRLTSNWDGSRKKSVCNFFSDRLLALKEGS